MALPVGYYASIATRFAPGGIPGNPCEQPWLLIVSPNRGSTRYLPYWLFRGPEEVIQQDLIHASSHALKIKESERIMDPALFCIV